MTERDPSYYAELKAYQEFAWWSTHYLSIIAHEHYGYSLEKVKPLEDAERAIWDFTFELGKELVAEHPDDRQDWLDIFYGNIQYWQQCGPVYWEKHAKLDEAFDRVRRELL